MQSITNNGRKSYSVRLGYKETEYGVVVSHDKEFNTTRITSNIPCHVSSFISVEELENFAKDLLVLAYKIKEKSL